MTTRSETFRVVSKRALDGFPSRISHAHASCDPAKSYSQLVCSGMAFGGMWSVSPGSPRGGRTMLMMVPACSWVGWIGLPYASARRLEAAWKRARKSALPSGFVAVRRSKYAPRQRLVMELVGLEPTTSRVRFAQTSVARSSFALVGRYEVRSVLPSSLGLVARFPEAAAATAPVAVGKATKNASPWVSTSTPPRRRTHPAGRGGARRAPPRRRPARAAGGGAWSPRCQ